MEYENRKKRIPPLVEEETGAGDSRRSCGSDLHRSGVRDDKKGGRKKAAIYRGGEGHWLSLIYLNRYPIG